VQVPVLDTPQGSIFESNAIARYIARLRADSELNGSSFFESAQIDQWIDFSANELEPPAAMWIYPIRGYMTFDKEVRRSVTVPAPAPAPAPAQRQCVCVRLRACPRFLYAVQSLAPRLSHRAKAEWLLRTATAAAVVFFRRG
jgi:hypothetical protein